MDGLWLERNDKIVFMGDSITDCGRNSEAHRPFGAGYVATIRNLLLARYPGHDFTIVNNGISGNTIRDLKARWEADAIAPQPDLLSVKIGINDVWRFVANRIDQAVPLDEFEATYRELLRSAREHTKARLILMEPYVLELDASDHFRKLMNTYIPVVAKLAKEFDARLVRTQAAFDTVMSMQPSSFWAGDRVHPGGPGHAVMARAWLKEVGYEF